MKITNLSENAEDFTGNVWKIENNNKISLIDAGKGDVWEQIKDLDRIDKIILTHSHYDHVDNLPKIVEEFSPEIYAYNPENISVDAKRLRNNELTEASEVNLKVIHTPGHKDDSICLYNAENKILFTGDLIFAEGGFGRTDLEEGDRDQLIESIEKITNLDVSKFYPGHDDKVETDANEKIKESLENAKKREAKYE